MASPKPQKIIKLTVKPPVQPIKKHSFSHNSKKQQYSPEEERHTKKHKTLDETVQRSHRV